MMSRGGREEWFYVLHPHDVSMDTNRRDLCTEKVTILYFNILKFNAIISS